MANFGVWNSNTALVFEIDAKFRIIRLISLISAKSRKLQYKSTVGYGSINRKYIKSNLVNPDTFVPGKMCPDGEYPDKRY